MRKKPSVTKPRGVPERPSEKKRKNRARVLAMLPGTQVGIHKKTLISQATVCRWLADLVDKGEAHIGDWKRSRKGGPFTAVYVAGPGEPVPCTLSPMTKAELHKRYYAKVRKDQAAQRAETKASRAWVAAFQPRRCELSSALFGAAA